MALLPSNAERRTSVVSLTGYNQALAERPKYGEEFTPHFILHPSSLYSGWMVTTLSGDSDGGWRLLRDQ